MGLVMLIKTSLEAGAPTIHDSISAEKKGGAFEVLAKDVKWDGHETHLRDSNILITIEEEDHNRIVGVATAKAIGADEKGWFADHISVTGFFAREPHPMTGMTKGGVSAGLAECINRLSLNMNASKLSIDESFAKSHPESVKQLAQAWGMTEAGLALEPQSSATLQ
jgi:hypothetical protein